MPSEAYGTGAMQPPQVPPDEALSFRFRMRTRWSDEDALGVLNNAVYLTLCEEGRLRWCRELGLLDARERDFPFVLGTTVVRFVAPGRGGEEIELRMGTTRLGRRSFTQVYRVAGADGKVWAEIEADLVIWDPAARRSGPMPETFRAAVLAREHPVVGA